MKNQNSTNYSMILGSNKIIYFIFFMLMPMLGIAQSAVYPSPGTLYDGQLHTIHIVMHPDSLEALYADENRWNNHTFPVTFIYDQTDTLRNVGIRLKGNTSRNARKKSFRIDTDEFINQTYQGLKTFNLNGTHNDPSLTRQYLASYFIGIAGIHTPRSNFVKLYINNTYYGLYTHVEHINRKFIESRYSDNTGNLYKCSWPADLTWLGSDPQLYKNLINPSPQNERAYDLKTNETLDDYSDLVNFINVINNSQSDSFQYKIEQVFEVRNFLRNLAAEVLMGHWDNYFMNKNNYQLYRNPSTGKFNYLSYDMDNTFGVQWGYSNIDVRDVNNWGNINASAAPLCYKLLAIEEYKNYYNKQVKNLCDSFFNIKLITEIDRVKLMIDQAVATDSFYTQQWESDYGYTYLDWQNSFTQSLGNHASIGIKNYIANRRPSALNQIRITGIGTTFHQAIQVYPNPALNHVYIDAANQSLLNLRIYSQTSALLFHQQYSSTQTVELNLETFENGIYLLEMELNTGEKVLKKLIISR